MVLFASVGGLGYADTIVGLVIWLFVTGCALGFAGWLNLWLLRLILVLVCV